MKKTILMMAALGLSNAALADQPGRNWLSRPALHQAIARQGYQITKVEADDGHWEGEMTRARKLYEFHADPLSGHLTKIELKDED
jgi:hypothetical protein